MAPVSEAAFRALLRGCPRERFAAFVADLWAAGGQDVRRDGTRLVVDGADGEQVVRAVVDPADAPDAGRPDVLVVATDPPERDDVRVVGPAELRRRLLYAVPREEAAALFERHFDRPLVAEDGPDAGAERHGHAPSDASGDPPKEGNARDPRDRDGAPGTRDREEGPETRDRDGTARAGAGGPGAGHGEDSAPGDGRSVGRRAAVAGLVVAIVVVVGLLAAGAGLGPGGGPSTATPDAPPTDGAAGVGGMPEGDPPIVPPNASAGVTGDGYPPGIGQGGITTPRAVGGAHGTALAGRSYTLIITHREFRDGRPTGYRQEVVQVASPTVYRSRVRGAGDLVGEPLVVAAIEAYANGTHRYTRAPDGTFRRREIVTAPELPGLYASRAAATVSRHVAADRSSVVATRPRGNVTYYFLELRGAPVGRNATGTAVVDSRGIVHELRRRYYDPRRNRTVAVSMQVVALGETTVSPPPWYDEARNATEGHR